jgi:phosphoglycolate phosphatase
MLPECNICGSTDIRPGGARGLPVCHGCSAHPVTRVMWLTLIARNLLAPGKRVLHIAPERALAPRLRAILGDNYEPVDIDPAAYAHVPGVRKMDLCADAPKLPSKAYDLILHSHVMEHVQCNVTAVLAHLHRALREDGFQVCCIPFRREQHSAEDLGPLSAEEAERRFGQDDHVRTFGALDVPQTLGMIFALPDRYDLADQFGPDLLDRHAIPDIARTGWTAHSVLALGKSDLLLDSAR